uniref:DUF4189 domain-containing protein n=1 Tax=Globodera pallida TaxID=36090 RepID=A0A183BXN2_GLOPA
MLQLCGVCLHFKCTRKGPGEEEIEPADDRQTAATAVAPSGAIGGRGWADGRTTNAGTVQFPPEAAAVEDAMEICRKRGGKNEIQNKSYSLSKLCYQLAKIDSVQLLNALNPMS